MGRLVVTRADGDTVRARRDRLALRHRGNIASMAKVAREARDAGIAGGVIVIIWYLMSLVFPASVFPSPLAVALTAKTMFGSGALSTDTLKTLDRVIVGYGLGVGAGVAGGVVVGLSKYASRYLTMAVSFIRVIPPVALVPLAIVWFGIGNESKYFIVLEIVALIVFVGMVDGIRSTSETKIMAARCLGASRVQTVFRIVVPSAVPYMLTAARISVGLAFAADVAAELIAANHGLGALILQSSQLLETNRMFVGLATLAVVGGVADRFVWGLGNLVFRRYLSYTNV